MSQDRIRFDDGAGYERYMGDWSQRAGDRFLDWLAPPTGRRWLDVGCGNGAFTELIVRRCLPDSVVGVDPSLAQLAFARTRPNLHGVALAQGDAMALPFAAATFDVAVMPLVIFFVPDPAQSLQQMVRAVAPGGTVCAYAWDLPGGGFPYHGLQQQLRELGASVPVPPSVDASSLSALTALWRQAALDAVATDVIRVTRTFTDFADYWATLLTGPSVAAALAALTPAQQTRLQSQLREKLAPGADGRIVCHARANAIRGTVPH